jgi:hypothetical protein
MNIKRILRIVIICSAILATGPIYAHEISTDGPISATMHIEPADEPGAGEFSYLHFIFQDSERKLDVTKCDCSVSLQKDSATYCYGRKS